MKTLAALGIALSCASTAWPAAADEPKTFVAVNQSYYSTIKGYDASGAVQQGTCPFVSHGESIYVAHTLNPRDSWFADTAYYAVSACGAQTQGLSDVEIGFQRGISTAKAPTQFAIRASFGVPSGYSIASNPRLGLGRPDLQAGVVYNGGFHIGPKHFGFVNAGVAGKVYTGYPAPQLLTNASVGYGVTPGVLVIASYFGATHMGAGGTLTNIGTNPTINSVYDSYASSASVVIKLTSSISIAANVSNQLGGRSVGIGQNYGIGFWGKF